MPANSPSIPIEWSRRLGARRTAMLRRLTRRSGLPPETLIELALEMLDLASQKLAPSPVSRQAVGLGIARWRNVDAKERSEIMSRAANARWARQRADSESRRVLEMADKVDGGSDRLDDAGLTGPRV